MPDIHSLEPTIFGVLCQCFGLTPNSAEANYRFRPAYQEDTTLPQPPRNKDVCYYSLSPESAQDPQPLTVFRKNSLKDVWQRVVPVSLHLYFYGPHADDDALLTRTMLYTDSIRAALRTAGIIPIPSPPAPVSLPEIEGTLWRQRADLTISLRILQQSETSATSITVPPELLITNNDQGSDSSC